MPLLVQEVIDEGARRLNDPNKGKLSTDSWTIFFNDACEKLTRDYKVLDRDATHDITVNEDRYTYPEDCVQMKSWFYAIENPVVPTSHFQEAGELFEDEYAEVVRWMVPTGDSGFRYWARAGDFVITPKPTATNVAAGKIRYWKLATRVELAEVPTAVFELPATLRKLTRDLMVIYAKQSLHRYDEADRDLLVWEAEMAVTAERLEDRSDNRHPRVRLRTARQPFAGMN